MKTYDVISKHTSFEVKADDFHGAIEKAYSNTVLHDEIKSIVEKDSLKNAASQDPKDLDYRTGEMQSLIFMNTTLSKDQSAEAAKAVIKHIDYDDEPES